MDSVSFFDFDVNELSKRKGLKWNRYERDVIPMWVADTDYRVAPEIKRAILQATQEEDLHYADDSGLVDCMVNKINRINNIPVQKEGIYILQGVLPAMWLACQYACDHDEEVIVTNPMYHPFYRAAETAGITTIYWPLCKDNQYRFDIEDVKEQLTPKTKLLFLCNPHNPTGRVMTRSELAAIADLAIDHKLLVASDELWEEIVYEHHPHISIASLGTEIAERTITFFGFSKSYNIAGLQIGYAATTNTQMVQEMKQIARGILRGATTISQAVAKRILRGDVEYYVKAELKYLHEAREYSLQRLQEIDGVEPNDLEGTYLLFPNIASYGIPSKEMVNHLLHDAKVGVLEGSRFGSNGEGHIRINIGTSLSILREAFDRIESSLRKLSK
jgi:bifunctional pyridoxal-dependent enzyme with beta-cystathionase and maltose regulon repressor activities